MKPLQLINLQGATKGLCDPKSRFWLRWAPRVVIISLFLSLGWMAALNFLIDVRLNPLEDSTFAKSLKESQVLVMFHCALVGSAIPMLLDVFLDFIELKLRKGATDEVTLVHFRTRALILFTSLVPTIVYGGICLFGNDADLRRLPFMYALSLHAFKGIMVTFVVLLMMPLGKAPNVLLLAALIPWYTVGPIKMTYLLRPSDTKLLRVADSISKISCLLFLVCLFFWARDIWRRYKDSRGKPIKMETTEVICIVYWCGKGCPSRNRLPRGTPLTPNTPFISAFLPHFLLFALVFISSFHASLAFSLVPYSSLGPPPSCCTAAAILNGETLPRTISGHWYWYRSCALCP